MPATGQKTETIYIDLDTLMDTRLGTIARLNDSVVDDVLAANYHNREIDEFDGIDMAAYRALYATRDVETLKHSGCTDAIVLLQHVIEQLNEQAKVRPYHDATAVMVNAYPYQLSPQESDAFGQSIAVWMPAGVRVEMVYLTLEELTPQYCKERFAMLVMYDYAAWLGLHTKLFETTRLPEVVLFGPALYFERKPTEEELARELKEAAHPMRAMEIIASPIVELQLIDVKYFSIISKETIMSNGSISPHS